MYARTVGDQALTFGVSGMLYKDGLVMFDRETDTLWTHVDGRAVRGKLLGRQLEIVPSVHATWKEWLALYPNSQVLRKRGEFRSSYERYNRSASQLGIQGRRNPDTRLPGKERVLGVRNGDEAMAFPIKTVRGAGVAHAQVGSLVVVVASPGPNLPLVAYSRRVGNRVLRFTLAEHEGRPALRDEQSGTTWDIATGRSVAGTLAGEQLARAPAYPAFWFGWASYFPNSEIWGPPEP